MKGSTWILLLTGGAIAYLVSRSAKASEAANRRAERQILRQQADQILHSQEGYMYDAPTLVVPAPAVKPAAAPREPIDGSSGFPKRGPVMTPY